MTPGFRSRCFKTPGLRLLVLFALILAALTTTDAEAKRRPAKKAGSRDTKAVVIKTLTASELVTRYTLLRENILERAASVAVGQVEDPIAGTWGSAPVSTQREALRALLDKFFYGPFVDPVVHSGMRWPKPTPQELLAFVSSAIAICVYESGLTPEATHPDTKTLSLIQLTPGMRDTYGISAEMATQIPPSAIVAWSHLSELFVRKVRSSVTTVKTGQEAVSSAFMGLFELNYAGEGPWSQNNEIPPDARMHAEDHLRRAQRLYTALNTELISKWDKNLQLASKTEGD